MSMQVLTNGNILTWQIHSTESFHFSCFDTIPWASDYNLDAIVQYIQQKFPKILGQMQK